MKNQTRLSLWDIVYAVNMCIACAISYWIVTYVLAFIVDRDSDLLGGMWAAVATVFVFRASREDSWSAGIARLVATTVSFALCLLYLWLFPFSVAGMAALIALGTLTMMLLDRRDDVITTAITTVVVMVVAAIAPVDAWHEPLLRLVDTIIGVATGVVCKWAASFMYFSFAGKPVR